MQNVRVRYAECEGMAHETRGMRNMRKGVQDVRINMRNVRVGYAECQGRVCKMYG